MSITTTCPGGARTLTKPSTSPPTAGAGGELLKTWTLNGTTRTDYAIHLPSQFITNSSDYPLWVPGINFPNSTKPGSERVLGVGVEGRLRDTDYRAIKGTVTFVDDDGTIIGSIPVEGEYVAVAPPTDGVRAGSNAAGAPTYNVYIEPADGLPQYQANAPDAGFLDYGWFNLSGSVTDSRGDPVPNTTVQVNGSGFTTDSTGEYTVTTPEGIDATFTALSGTSSRDLSPQQGDSVDFQFGGVSVKVSDPSDGSPYEGVPVEINGSEIITGPDGIATDTQLGIGYHEVTIMDSYDLTVQVGFEGNHQSVGLDDVEKSDTGFTGVEVRVRDAETGRPVEGTPTKIPGQGIRSSTGPDGTGSVLHDYPADGDDFEIVVADGDPRYNVTGLVRSPDAAEDTVLLEVEPAVPTVDM